MREAEITSFTEVWGCCGLPEIEGEADGGGGGGGGCAGTGLGLGPGPGASPAESSGEARGLASAASVDVTRRSRGEGLGTVGASGLNVSAPFLAAATGGGENVSGGGRRDMVGRKCGGWVG